MNKQQLITAIQELLIQELKTKGITATPTTPTHYYHNTALNITTNKTTTKTDITIKNGKLYTITYYHKKGKHQQTTEHLANPNAITNTINTILKQQP